MLTALAAFAIGQMSSKVVKLHPIGDDSYELQIMQREDRLDPPKNSPKKFNDEPWQFDWITIGLGVESDPHQLQRKVVVYSQERKDKDDRSIAVARMAMQIWDRAFHRLKLASSNAVDDGQVEFFLCFGGKPGGEQLFGTEIRQNVSGPAKGGSEQLFDIENRPGPSGPVKVNTIYIYRLDTFNEPVEMAREVAHEYGHAILPAIGGFKQPEVWANGYLGEKLFLRWLRNDMAGGGLTKDDAMGAGLQGLSAWVDKNVDPLVQQAAVEYPSPSLINEAKSGMDSFIGMALYIESLCPPSVFIRSLQYTADAHRTLVDLTPPADYPQNVVQAASEVENLTLSIPANIFESKRHVWIPLGKGKVTGAAVISKKDGWAEVAPLTPTLSIKNPPIGQ